MSAYIAHSEGDENERRASEKTPANHVPAAKHAGAPNPVLKTTNSTAESWRVRRARRNRFRIEGVLPPGMVCPKEWLEEPTDDGKEVKP